MNRKFPGLKIAPIIVSGPGLKTVYPPDGIDVSRMAINCDFFASEHVYRFAVECIRFAKKCPDYRLGLLIAVAHLDAASAMQKAASSPDDGAKCIARLAREIVAGNRPRARRRPVQPVAATLTPAPPRKGEGDARQRRKP